MALSDQWSLSTLRAACQRELLDPSSQWWSAAELNGYINLWQQELQSRFEFVWGSSTYVNGQPLTWITATNSWDYYATPWDALVQSLTSTFTLSTAAPSCMRIDAIYFTPGGTETAIARLPMRDKLDIEYMARDWRSQGTGLDPYIAYQDSATTVSFWPPAFRTGTFIFEYPLLTTFATDTSTMVVPPWTRYDCVPYVMWKALSRFGPNQDLPKALRYKRVHDRNLKRFRRIYDSYFPEKAEMLRPGRRYARDILSPTTRIGQRP